MANWTQQLREAYQKLIEAELLRGQEAVRKQAKLAAEGKPFAVQAVRRVEQLPMSPSQIPSPRGNSRKIPIGDRAAKEPFDIENLGFADAQTRPDPRGRKSDEMQRDANFTQMFDGRSGHLGFKNALSPIEQEVRDAKARVRRGYYKRP